MNFIKKLFKFILWTAVAFCVLVVVLGLMKTDASKYFGKNKTSFNEKDNNSAKNATRVAAKKEFDPTQLCFMGPEVCNTPKDKNKQEIVEKKEHSDPLQKRYAKAKSAQERDEIAQEVIEEKGDSDILNDTMRCYPLPYRLYTLCFSKELKVPIYGIAIMFGDTVDKNTIKKRYNFMLDGRFEYMFRIEKEYYKGSGFDMGFFVANSDSFDFAEIPLKMVYIMTNVVPQEKNTHKYSVKLVEEQGRSLAKKYKVIWVEELSVFKKNYKTFGDKKIAIPSGFLYRYSTISDAKGNHKDFCYYVPNDNQRYTLKQMEKDCQNADIPLMDNRLNTNPVCRNYAFEIMRFSRMFSRPADTIFDYETNKRINPTPSFAVSELKKYTQYAHLLRNKKGIVGFAHCKGFFEETNPSLIPFFCENNIRHKKIKAIP